MLNYFDKLQRRVNQYRDKYEKKPRKAAIKLAWWNFKCMFKKFKFSDGKSVKFTVSDASKLYVLIRLHGGLGDKSVSVNYLMQLKEKSGDVVVFDVAVEKKFFDDIKIMLHGHSFVRNIVKEGDETNKYDVVVEFCRVPVIEYWNEEKTLQIAPFFADWMKCINNFNTKYPEYLRAGSVSDRLLAEYTVYNGRNRVQEADIDNMLNITSKFRINTTNDEEVLNKFDLRQQKYILFQAGAGIYSTIGGQSFSTREWSVKNFEVLIDKLKRKYPNYKFVQIGYAAHEKIANVDCQLCGVTKFDELLILLKNAKILITTESGPVHFRHFLNEGISCVLFGPTDYKFFGYEENINVCSKVCRGCEWLNNIWQSTCVKSGCNEAVCMKSITPEMVLDKIEQYNVL